MTPISVSAPAVLVHDLFVERGGRTVIPSLSADVPTGVVTGLLGPSGCGKTTLMRAIVGVQRVAGGSVTVLGLPAGTPQLRQRVAYMTQAPSVYADLTVLENLRYFAALVGGRERIVSVVATVGLGDRPRPSSAISPAVSGREPPSPSPCLGRQSCSCSTSQRSASTPGCGASSGRRSTGWRPTGRRYWSRRT